MNRAPSLIKPSRGWLWLALAGAAGIALAAACGGPDSPHGAPAAPPSVEPAGPCTEGATKTCGKTIGEHSGVLSCFQGESTCTGGKWGPCEGGTIANYYTGHSGFYPMALSDAGSCNDICDPSCMNWDELPDGGMTPPPGGGAFAGANPELLPGGFTNKGVKDCNHPPGYEGCTGPGDCQFDHYCDKTTCCGPDMNCGMCKPYGMGEYDKTSVLPNYTLAVPCTKIIACNRGGAVAPAGAKVTVLNGNSKQMQENLGLCAAGEGTIAGQVYTPTPLNPGECQCIPGGGKLLKGTQSMVINFADYAPPLFAETLCEDNWSVSAETLGLPDCESCRYSYQKISFDVTAYVFHDKSMVSDSTQKLFAPAKAGLRAFVQEAASEGLNAALRFTGDDPAAGCNYSACDATACGTPKVGPARLTAAAAPGDAQEEKLITLIDATVAQGVGRPYRAIVEGTTSWASAYSKANLGGTEAVIWILAASLYGCETDIALIAKFAADALKNDGIKTHIIALQNPLASDGPVQADLDKIAAAGGTTAARYLSTSDAATAQAFVLKSLQDIRTELGIPKPCSFKLDSAPFLVGEMMAVRHNGVNLVKVADATACNAGGWYFDNNECPTAVILCPNTCSGIRTVGGNVEIIANCPYYPRTLTFYYTAECPPGTQVQWGYMSWDTACPGDSNVTFSVKTAFVVEDLPTATLVKLGTAKLGAEDCLMSGPAPCPADLYTALGKEPQANAKYLQLDMYIVPTKDKLQTATINEWEITYSCPPAE
ncbi:MAG: hypothetical protein HY744_04750 [Deltaproteobacteria bacterium]|nr:hypothetical protein [Deltaproteobacteria bacterium]